MVNNIIEITDIRKSYQIGTQSIEVLKGINICIKKGEYVAIMGPSGSGKTTLMNIIGALDSTSSGQYILNGTNVNHLGDERLAEIRNKEIGFVFQTFNLLSQYSALENITLPLIYAGIPKHERIERATQVINRIGLNERASHKPSEMSGGQRQRVAIARALINNPSIILADEPTGNLDSKTSIGIMRLFDEIHTNGNTIILVTHEEDIADYAHRIIRLKDGVIESDTTNKNITVLTNDF